MSLSIRAITLEDADAVERLYAQSAKHLRALGDQTNFSFSAEPYGRDGFGERRPSRGSSPCSTGARPATSSGVLRQGTC